MESITFSLYPGIAYLEAEIQIQNPGAEQVEFAHWVNPMWVPGGKNELTDNTEFILPTERILVEERWQQEPGTQPSDMAETILSGSSGTGRWEILWRMGSMQVSTERIHTTRTKEWSGYLIPSRTPGWISGRTGFSPRAYPMGSGSPSKGYVEIWGGTVKQFPNELRPLEAGGPSSVDRMDLSLSEDFRTNACE